MQLGGALANTGGRHADTLATDAPLRHPAACDHDLHTLIAMQRPHRPRHLRPDTGRAGRYDAEPDLDRVTPHRHFDQQEFM
jgi:hypothetical protein